MIRDADSEDLLSAATAVPSSSMHICLDNLVLAHTLKIQKHSRRKIILASLQYKENLKHVEIERARFLCNVVSSFLVQKAQNKISAENFPIEGNHFSQFLMVCFLHRIKAVHMMKLVSALDLRFFFAESKLVHRMDLESQ